MKLRGSKRTSLGTGDEATSPSKSPEVIKTPAKGLTVRSVTPAKALKTPKRSIGKINGNGKGLKKSPKVKTPTLELAVRSMTPAQKAKALIISKGSNEKPNRNDAGLNTSPEGKTPTNTADALKNSSENVNENEEGPKASPKIRTPEPTMELVTPPKEAKTLTTSLGSAEKINGNSNIKRIDIDALKKHVDEENDFIKAAVNSIPPEIYFNSDSIAKIRENQHAQMDEKLEETGLVKKRPKLSKVTKQKRLKLDPMLKKNVTDIIEDLSAEKMAQKEKEMKKGNIPAAQLHVGPLASMDELKERLEAKIALLRGKKVYLADKKELKKIDRRIKKIKIKQKRRERMASGLQLTPNEKQKETIKTPIKPVYNKEGKMVFSKFDFAETGTEERKKGPYSGKDYKKLLKKVENDETKVKELEEKDEAKAEKVKDKKIWKTALARAEGVKVKDDVELLRKAVKKQEGRKKKSKKEWAAREESVKHKQEMKQKKRKENIDARKKEKIKKKIKVAVKKGRIIPGFS